jgi:pimeloyl-ACP methyl ester carboxylesterase
VRGRRSGHGDDRGEAQLTADAAAAGDALVAFLQRTAAEKGLAVAQVTAPLERDALAGRIRLHYLEWGRRGDPAVILLHAGRMNAHSWDLVCLQLAGGYHCLALDARGNGDSEWAADLDYSVETCGQDVVNLADALGLERFFLAGQSLGGFHALSCAARNPGRVLGLALADVAAEIQAEGARRQVDRMAVFEPLDSFEDFVQLAARERPGRDLDKLRFTLAQNLRRRADGKWTWKYDVRWRATVGMADFQASFNLVVAEIPNIRCPALLMRGAQSDVVGPEDARRMAGRMARARQIEIPGARHILSLDNPAAVAAAMRAFFAEVGGA